MVKKFHRRSGTVSLWASSAEHPVDAHPNAVAFSGCLTTVDVASDKAPSGARGHRCILTRAAAEAALPSLLGMAIDFKSGWDGHDGRQKCGIITAAYFEGDRLLVGGFLFAKDFPEVITACRRMDLGMSYELHEAHVENMHAAVWTLTRATFTGAAVLLREKAAYTSTSFELKALSKPQSKKRKGVAP